MRLANDLVDYLLSIRPAKPRGRIQYCDICSA